MITLRRILQEDTLGQKVDKAADEINAEVIDDNMSKGVIEKELDRALTVNKRVNRQGGNQFLNILFIGEAGTGKTSRIRAWARQNGINLYEVRCAGMDDTDLGGAISPNKEGTVVNRLASTEFDVLDQPNSVLFLDEYNRAPGSVRTNLLELVNSHVVPDPREPSGQRKLKGFLFTVAAINPATNNYGTDDMDMAEKTRFKHVHVPSEKPQLLRWLKQEYGKDIADARADGDTEWEKEVQGKLKLAETILKSPEFKFDEAEEIDATVKKGNGLALNNRTLFELLQSCDGTKDDFLAQWNQFCNSNKKSLVTTILKDYKDIDDIANDALKGHDTKSSVFTKSESTMDRINNVLKGLKK